MGNDRPTKRAAILVLLAAVMLAPGSTLAGGHKPPGKSGNDPSVGSPAPMPAAYPYPAVMVDQAASSCCYAVPILAVYQCPAVLAGQPGSQVRYLRSDPRLGLLGGRSYLYHR